jgi:hypothetical protein
MSNFVTALKSYGQHFLNDQNGVRQDFCACKEVSYMRKKLWRSDLEWVL